MQDLVLHLLDPVFMKKAFGLISLNLWALMKGLQNKVTKLAVPR